MTWIYVTANMTLGGGDQVLLAYARAVRNTNNRIVLFSLEPIDESACVDQELRAAGVEICQLSPSALRFIDTIVVLFLIPMSLLALAVTARRWLQAAVEPSGTAKGCDSGTRNTTRRAVRITTPLAAAQWLRNRLHLPFVVRQVRRFLLTAEPATGLHVFHAVACEAMKDVLHFVHGPTLYTEITSPAGYGLWTPDISPLLPRFSRVVVPSDLMADLVARMTGGRAVVRVIPFPIQNEDQLLRLDAPPGHGRYGIIGRLSAEKCHHAVLDATVLITRQCPEAHLVVAGSGPLRGALETRVRELGLASNVSFLGRFAAVGEVMAPLDVLVLASRTEGMPLSVLEAMASGRPVVATPVGAIPEMLIEGKTGFLVPIGDARALADRVVTLLRDREMSREMGQAGRQVFLERYSYARVQQLTSALYDEFATAFAAPSQVRPTGEALSRES